MTDDDYYTIRSAEALTGRAGRPSPLRAAGLFAALAIALAVVAVPAMGDRSGRLAQRSLTLDPITTGSIERSAALPMRRRSDSGRTYIVRRSVLSNGSVCVLAADGSRQGAC